MLYCALVAGPDEIFFGRKGLAVLHEPKFSFGYMADHSVHHHLIFGSLRSRLNDDVTQRDGLEAGDYGWSLAIDTVYDTRRHCRVLIVGGLRGCGLHNGSRGGCQSELMLIVDQLFSSLSSCLSESLDTRTASGARGRQRPRSEHRYLRVLCACRWDWRCMSAPSSGLGPYITTLFGQNAAVHHSKNCALMS